MSKKKNARWTAKAPWRHVRLKTPNELYPELVPHGFSKNMVYWVFRQPDFQHINRRATKEAVLIYVWRKLDGQLEAPDPMPLPMEERIAAAKGESWKPKQ